MSPKVLEYAGLGFINLAFVVYTSIVVYMDVEAKRKPSIALLLCALFSSIGVIASIANIFMLLTAAN